MMIWTAKSNYIRAAIWKNGRVKSEEQNADHLTVLEDWDHIDGISTRKVIIASHEEEIRTGDLSPVCLFVSSRAGSVWFPCLSS